ncbi:hypothetical protein G6011_10217 [Alternaria panax]|uniref:Uncharacterized protein n=1 Tax=Alternaria panax TaxID=48097 RepID=A0AAD4NPB1_9PLEO|nr:hypothetical protein G6011_10217 [Alternaria panax]
MAFALTKANELSRWRTGLTYYTVSGVELKGWITLLALLLPLLFIVALARYRKMQYQHKKPFPFLKLPQELRDMVYEHFLDDPQYPPPARNELQRSSLNWMTPARWASTSTSSDTQHESKAVFLANKQVYGEYMDMICKRKTFHLSVTPQTYRPTNTPASPSPFSLATYTPVWDISPTTLSKMQNCSLKLITTSSMLGVTDPRSMTSSSWTLGRRMREQLKHMSSVKTFTLDAKALGDPLWNPLWIWYHASQSLKLLGTEFSDTVPRGPQLTQITFSLDTWSPGENYLKRDVKGDGGWMWYCMKNHPVGADVGAEMTVREFCGKLYQECSICRADEEQDMTVI